MMNSWQRCRIRKSFESLESCTERDCWRTEGERENRDRVRQLFNLGSHSSIGKRVDPFRVES